MEFLAIEVRQNRKVEIPISSDPKCPLIWFSRLFFFSHFGITQFANNTPWFLWLWRDAIFRLTLRWLGISLQDAPRVVELVQWTFPVVNTVWWFGLVFYVLRIVIPTNFHMFQRGCSTTNQINFCNSAWLPRYLPTSFSGSLETITADRPNLVRCLFHYTRTPQMAAAPVHQRRVPQWNVNVDIMVNQGFGSIYFSKPRSYRWL